MNKKEVNIDKIIETHKNINTEENESNIIKEMKCIINSLEVEKEEVLQREYNLFNFSLNPVTKKFEIITNYFLNVFSIESKYIYQFKINENLFNKLIKKLKEINKENIEFTLLLNIKYIVDWDHMMKKKYILKDYEIIGHEIIKKYCE